MNYDEMKITWDSQNEKPIFEINEATLHKNVIEDSNHFGQELKTIQCLATLVLFGLSSLALFKSFSAESTAFYYISFGITFMAGSYQAWRLWLRHKFEVNFDESIEGILKKSISRIDYLIALIKSMIWWFVLPMLTLAGLRFYLLDSPKALIGFAALIFVFSVSYLTSKKEIHVKYLPKKRSFQVLLDKLQQK